MVERYRVNTLPGRITRDCPEVVLAFDYDALAARLAEAEAERLEQARLLGMSGSREAALLTRLAAAERLLHRCVDAELDSYWSPEAIAEIRAFLGAADNGFAAGDAIMETLPIPSDSGSGPPPGEPLHSIDCHVWHGPKWVGGKCTCGASDSGDDAPELTEERLHGGTWKIGGKVVSEEEGKAALRAAIDGSAPAGNISYTLDRTPDSADALPPEIEKRGDQYLKHGFDCNWKTGCTCTPETVAGVTPCSGE